MATKVPTVKKPIAEPLRRGSLAHAAEGFQALLKKQMPPAAHARVADAVKELMRDAGGKYLNPPMTVLSVFKALATRDGDARSLSAILSEGPMPGRLPRPPGSKHPAIDDRPTGKSGFTRKPDPGSSFQPYPGELEALISTGKLGPECEAAARRLGFGSKGSGSDTTALRSMHQYLIEALQSQKVKIDGHAGVHSNLFGPLAEFGLASSKEMRAAEDAAIRVAIESMKKRDPALYVPDYSAIEADIRLQPLTPLESEALSRSMGLLRRVYVADGVLDIELIKVRDAGGKKGQLVTDRMRGLLRLREGKPPEFTIVSIGESKAQSGYREIIGQIEEDVRRLLQGMRAPEGGSGAPIEFTNMQVKFGERLVVGWLSEVPPPEGHVARLKKNLLRDLGSRKQGSEEIDLIEIDPGSTFDDARFLAERLQAAHNALAAKPVP